MRLSEKGFSNVFPPDQKTVQKLNRVCLGWGKSSTTEKRGVGCGWAGALKHGLLQKGVFSRLRIAFEVPLLCLQ